MLPSKVVIVCDFSKNYSFILQDESQSFHWNKTQATIHPFVVYFKKEGNKVEHCSFVIILESLEHNTIAFLFISKETYLVFKIKA